MSKPKASAEDGKQLWRLLEDGRFHKAKDIDMGSRMIRSICSAYPDKFISTQKGYKRFPSATDDEISNAIADLKSRCGHLTRRYMAMEKGLRERHQPGLEL